MDHTASPPSSLADAVERLAASVLGVATRRHAGAALLWRPGLAVTSAALLWRAPAATLVLPDGESLRAEVRGVDPGTDLAVLAFDGGTLAPAARADGPATARVGDAVFAVGREPSGAVQASFGHLGLVGAAWRTWRGGSVDALLRLDGGLYPGLEGAAVGDAAGRLLGLASSQFSRHHGVVLPAATIDRVAELLLAHGRVPQGYVGIAVQPARTALEGAPVDGLLVSSVADGTPAAGAGLLVGDVVVAVAGRPATQPDDLRAQLQPGDHVALRVVRGGQAVELALAVGERPRGRCG